MPDVTVPLSDLTDRALLILLLERQLTMSADLSALQTAFSALKSALDASVPVQQATLALATRAVTTLETLSQQIAALQPDAAAIADLAAQAAADTAQLQSQAQEVATSNAALQAELDKVAPVTPPAAPATPVAG